MPDGPSVSVVLPAYNEAGSLEATVDRTLAALDSFLAPGEYEVIIAEDGCDDATPELAARLADTDDRISHLHSDRRLGRGRALTRAFRSARGDTLVYFDTDLATDLAHLEELVERVRSGEADVATGSRWIPGREADRPANRGVPSRVYNWLARTVLRSRIRDHQCGFKAFDRDALFDLLPAVGDDHWFWDTEVLVRAQRAGYTVAEFPVEWTPRGDTKVDLVRDVFGMGSQLVRTWWELSVRPRITPRVSIAAGIGLTVLAIGLMTLYLDPGAVVAEVGQADPVPLVAAAAVYLLSWPLRGARYRDILDRLGYHETVGFLTGAIFISQTGNLVFPARAGDAVRAYVVKTRRAVPYPSGFASLAVERVFDLLTITALAGTVLLGLVATGGAGIDVLGASLSGPEGRSGRLALQVAGFVGLLAVLSVVVIVVTARAETAIARRAIGRVSEDSYANEVAGVIERFAGDIQTATADGRAFARIGAGSVLIWTIDVVTAAFVLAAFRPGLSALTVVTVCFFAVSVGNLAKVLPLSPGGIGLYEGAFTLLVVALTPASVTAELALGAAIVDHAIKNAVTVVGGLTSMLVLNVSLTTAVEEAGEARQSRAD